MSKYWNTNTRKTSPYIPGEQPDDSNIIKLNANENPYPPSPLVIQELKKAANKNIRLYPDLDCVELQDVIAKLYSISKDQIFIGNGSDEVLGFCFMAYFESNRPILFPEITYSFYKVYSDIFNIPYKTTPMNQDLTINIDSYFTPNGGILIANPNAPTAISMNLSDIESIIAYNKDSVVIIDEAYIDFGGETAVSLIDKYPNLLVVQTMSKGRSLAGLRIGFAMGNKELIQGLWIAKNSFNSYTVDRVALKGAVASVKDKEYLAKTISRIIKTRDRITKQLIKLGFTVTDSKTNFLFITHKDYDAKDITAFLKENNILVRHFTQSGIENYIRVSIGTNSEMNKFIKLIKSYIRR